MNQRKTIAIVATGGTIAATSDRVSQLTDYNVTQGVSELLSAVPQLAELADLESHQLCNLDSRNMNGTLQLEMAQQLQQLLQQPHIAGIVVTHGTDTMEETALFLHLCLATTKAVVLVGAMRPASALSADGPMNLYQAVQVALHPEAKHRGVMMVSNDQVHLASRLRKIHSTSTEAFISNGAHPIGCINADGVHFHEAAPLQAVAPLIALEHIKQPLPQVDIIFDHPDANPLYYQTAIQSGSRGVVIAAVGNGSLSPAAHTGATLLYKQGIACVRSSRIPLGATTSSELDTQLHTIAGQFFSAQQCRIILLLAIASGRLELKEQRALFAAAWHHPR